MIEPSKNVPKKYWKYANKIPDRQLYKVEKAKLGLIFRCCDCKRSIPALEEHIRLLFRSHNLNGVEKLHWLCAVNVLP